MAIELFRVDDRLIHGQVVVGWGQRLGLGFLVVVDDLVARNDWEQDLYRMGTPPGVDVFFETVDAAAARIAEWQARPDPGILLTADVGTMDRLTAAVPAIRAVNVGGLHCRAGRDPCLPYVFVSPDDAAGLASMSARGVRVTAQDLPATTPVELGVLLHGAP